MNSQDCFKLDCSNFYRVGWALAQHDGVRMQNLLGQGPTYVHKKFEHRVFYERIRIYNITD